MAVSELSQNTTVTPALENDQYPLPHPEDIMAGHKFSKLHELFSSLSANDPWESFTYLHGNQHTKKLV